MRLGRIIVAGLAPLVGLSALTAYMMAQAAPAESAQQVSSADSLPGLFHAVVPLLMAAADSSPAGSLERPPAYAMLAFQALAATRLGGSLCLLASLVALDLLARRHTRSLLRC
jgi:hypothetical protein